MSGWGIARSATEKEKIKAEFNDYLIGLNSVGKIDYSQYSEMYDVGMELLDRMYDLGNVEANQWIPVKDHLPDEDGTYMTVTRRGRVRENHFHGCCGVGKFGYSNDATHWMPRPLPPKKGE